ncbi:MAG: hypothetical protein FJ119_15145 [Deltaproteobacteria bacterium]|nr:hypothetical protein [Deltaproteobacteria bacterium]
MNFFSRTAAVAVAVGCMLFPGAVCMAGEQSAEGKTLILYYSRTGNTRVACEALQKELGADMQEIRDLNSRDKGFGMIAGMFKTILGMRTKIEPATVDFEPYDRIIISAPIWAGTFGLAMRTFVKRNNFAGKDVLIFITADSYMKEKPRQKHKDLVVASNGNVTGYFQVQAADRIDGDKVPRTQEKIVEETLKLVPDIKACIEGKN